MKHAQKLASLTGVTFLGFALAALAAVSACGGKTTDEGTPQADSAVTIVDAVTDTGAIDSAAPRPDTSAGGSIFDATIPDITFDGGKTARGCYDCAVDKCESSVNACDIDDRCRGTFLCAVSQCQLNFTNFSCVAGCAFRNGVTSLEDPVVAKALAINNCLQDQCADVCPESPVGSRDSSVPEAANDTSVRDTAMNDTSAADTASSDAVADTGATLDAAQFADFTPQSSPSEPSEADLKSVDPAVVEVLQGIAFKFAGTPGACNVQLSK